jgi:hypothetical protein
VQSSEQTPLALSAPGPAEHTGCPHVAGQQPGQLGWVRQAQAELKALLLLLLLLLLMMM